MGLQKDVEDAINRHSAEGGSDTPDFILAEYLTDCLTAYNKAVQRRKVWWGDNKPADVLECKASPNFQA